LIPIRAQPKPAPMELVPDYPIETERLRLRPFSRGDVDAVFAYRSREDVTRYLFDSPMNREACAEAVQARVGQTTWEQEGDKIFLAVERLEDGTMMGEVSLILRSAEWRQAEIGYIFHPDFHGHGYASEACRRLLSLGFDDAGAHRVFARCNAANEASRRVMQRLGMREEAHFREHMLVKGTWEEELICALLEDEWRLQFTAKPR
jgi:RimJ/RimL family protein N-acetyltransferase